MKRGSRGLLAGTEGTTQWVTRTLARFASRSIPNFVSNSVEPRSPPMLDCSCRASWTNDRDREPRYVKRKQPRRAFSGCRATGTGHPRNVATGSRAIADFPKRFHLAAGGCDPGRDCRPSRLAVTVRPVDPYRLATIAAGALRSSASSALHRRIFSNGQNIRPSLSDRRRHTSSRDRAVG
jgi:hypothetical protein